MPRITPEHNLYLYQLLTEKLGIGAQQPLARLSLALEAEGLDPADLDCTDARELAESLGFIKVTAFRGGRVYVTVGRDKDLDQALEKAARLNDKPAVSAKGGRPWKHGRSQGVLRPVKPKKRRPQVQQSGSAKVAPSRGAAERPAGEPSEATAENAQDAKAADATCGETAAPKDAPGGNGLPLSEKLAGGAAPTTNTHETAPSSSPAESRAELPVEAPEALSEGAAAGAPLGQASVSVGEIDISTGEVSAASGDAQEEAASEEDVAGQESATTETTQEEVPSPSISLTITYDPYADTAESATDATGADAEHKDHSSVEAPATVLDAPAQPSHADSSAAQVPGEAEPAPAAPRQDLPRTISGDVHCPDAVMAVLYRSLPLGADVLATLDEDWLVALSAGTCTGTRSHVSFPLRYLKEDASSPVVVELRRSLHPRSGKQWSLEAVDGDDGSKGAHSLVGPEGLPLANHEPWAGLCPKPRDLWTLPSPERELASQVCLGSWDTALARLAALAAPEPWSLPGEAPEARFAILRAYLAATFHRLKAQGKIVRTADGSLAAFDTGLLTDDAQRILAVLLPTTGPIPWRLEGFFVEGTEGLDKTVTSRLAAPLERASYLASLDDVALLPERPVAPEADALLVRQMGHLPEGFVSRACGSEPEADITPQNLASSPRLRKALAEALTSEIARSVAWCRTNWRAATPAYDPLDNELRLLLPLRLGDPALVDRALVLAQQDSLGWKAVSLMSIEAAYPCARVISADLPAWLSRGFAAS